MAMIGKVLRMHHRDKKTVREIVRATSLSRNTARKYLRTDKAEPPQYRRRAVATKLAPFVEAVKMALLAHARRPRKEGRSAKALLKQIAEAGYEGGYTRLTDVAHEAVCEPGLLAGGVPEPGPRDAVRCPHQIVRGSGRGGPARHLRLAC